MGLCTGAWTTYQGPVTLKKNDSPMPSSHQMPISLQLGVRLHVLLPQSMLGYWLPWSHTGPMQATTTTVSSRVQWPGLIQKTRICGCFIAMSLCLTMWSCEHTVRSCQAHTAEAWSFNFISSHLIRKDACWAQLSCMSDSIARKVPSLNSNSVSCMSFPAARWGSLACHAPHALFAMHRMPCLSGLLNLT